MSKNKVVFTLGVFDTFHYGHLKLLERAKFLGDYLVVGVVSDEAVKKQKGENRPIINQTHRYAIVDSLKCVNATVFCKSFNPIKEFNDIYFTCNKIDIIVKGEDQEHLDYTEIIQKYPNVVVVTLGRTPDVSSSKIIEKIGGLENVSNK